MNITRTDNDNCVTLALDGWLDTISSPILGEAVDAIESAGSIVLDFDKVEYMASAGLRQVIACNRKAKELGAEFSVINVGSETLSVFKMTGLDKKLNIAEK